MDRDAGMTAVCVGFDPTSLVEAAERPHAKSHTLLGREGVCRSSDRRRQLPQADIEVEVFRHTAPAGTAAPQAEIGSVGFPIVVNDSQHHGRPDRTQPLHLGHERRRLQAAEGLDPPTGGVGDARHSGGRAEGIGKVVGLGAGRHLGGTRLGPSVNDGRMRPERIEHGEEP